MKTADYRGKTLASRLRWKFWSWLCGWSRICNSNAYTLVIYGDRCSPLIDATCYRDMVESGDGHCYCGKLQTAPLDGTTDAT